MVSIRLWSLLCLFVIGLLSGCSSLQSSAPPLAPLFLPTSEDLPRLTMLRHELDAKASQCVERVTCDQVYYAMGLVGLFENRETARTSFRQVIAHNAAGTLATSSQSWLQLIGNEESAVVVNGVAGPSTDLLAQFVREWMERQLLSGASVERPAVTSVQEQLVESSRAIQGMAKQLRERDRQITVLRAQLEALKMIDEDHQDHHRKVKPPASLRTADHSSGR